MFQKIKRVEYRRGMLNAGMKPEDLPLRIWMEREIPAAVHEVIHAEGLLNLGGVYGDPDAGDPVEYDYLKLVMDSRLIEITMFNRGITLFTSSNEKVRSIHRVLCKLVD